MSRTTSWKGFRRLLNRPNFDTRDVPEPSALSRHYAEPRPPTARVGTVTKGPDNAIPGDSRNDAADRLHGDHEVPHGRQPGPSRLGSECGVVRTELRR